MSLKFLVLCALIAATVYAAEFPARSQIRNAIAAIAQIPFAEIQRDIVELRAFSLDSTPDIMLKSASRWLDDEECPRIVAHYKNSERYFAMLEPSKTDGVTKLDLQEDLAREDERTDGGLSERASKEALTALTAGLLKEYGPRNWRAERKVELAIQLRDRPDERIEYLV